MLLGRQIMKLLLLSSLKSHTRYLLGTDGQQKSWRYTHEFGFHTRRQRGHDLGDWLFDFLLIILIISKVVFCERGTGYLELLLASKSAAAEACNLLILRYTSSWSTRDVLDARCKNGHVFCVVVLWNLDLLTHSRHRRQDINARDTLACERIYKPAFRTISSSSSHIHLPCVFLKTFSFGCHGVFSKNANPHMACLSLCLLPLSKMPGSLPACAKQISSPLSLSKACNQNDTRDGYMLSKTYQKLMTILWMLRKPKRRMDLPMCSPAFLRHTIYVDFTTGLVILHPSSPGSCSKTD